MKERFDRAQELIDRPPQEGLALEIKTWIDPEKQEGQFKIIKAALALRNNDGGHLIIGFNDITREPDEDGAPKEVRKVYDIEKIQALISKFSSEKFEIFIDFPVRNEQEYPVLTIPSGVKTPVAAAANLPSDTGRLIAINDVYVRTLDSNHKASSSKVCHKDWPRLMDICFDNREADIGRFLRRNLSGANLEIIRNLVATVHVGSTVVPSTVHEKLEDFCRQGLERARQVFTELAVPFPPNGFTETALLLDGPLPPRRTDRTFLNLLASVNPHHSGWTPWFIGHRLQLPKFPRFASNSWENVIVRDYQNNMPEFMKLSAEGRFYNCRGFQEDYESSAADACSWKILDIDVLVIRTAESISVGLSFAREMGCPPEATKLCFLFRWTGLGGRRLLRRLARLGDTFLGDPSVDPSKTSIVEVPLETPHAALAEYVHIVLSDLGLLFGGYVIEKHLIEVILKEFFQR